MNYDLIIYVAVTNPYARLVRVIDGEQWDVTAGALDRAATWGDTDIALAKDSNIGGIPVAIPVTLPGGDYDLLIYDSSSPADTDLPVIGKRIRWSHNEKKLMGLPQDL